VVGEFDRTFFRLMLRSINVFAQLTLIRIVLSVLLFLIGPGPFESLGDERLR
jgi:hypothetical protein